MKAEGSAYPWAPPTVWGFAELGAADLYRAVLENESAGLWLDAALALCDGAFVQAAGIYESFGARNSEAEARVLAARRLRLEGEAAAAERQASLAAAYFASVGAAARLRELESLLAATA